MASLIPEAWGVPERFRQRLGAEAGRQRARVEEGHVLLVLHERPEPGDIERSARLFWRAPAGEWKATGTKGNGLAALKDHVEGYRDAIQQLDDEVENAASAVEIYHVLRSATPLTRAARYMHRALEEARDELEHRDILLLRDAAGDVERASELLLSDAKNALDYIDAKAAEEQTVLARATTDAQHRLNLIAAFCLPVTAVGSVFGMNLTSGIEGGGIWVFWLVTVAGFGMGFFVRGTIRGEHSVPLPSRATLPPRFARSSRAPRSHRPA